MPPLGTRATALICQLAAALALAPARAMLNVQPCGSAAPGELWTLTAAGQLVSTSTGFCATAAAPPPVPEGTDLAMQVCGAPGAPAQTFSFLSNNTIVLAAQTAMCVNVKAYGKTPGSFVWLATCDTNGCEGNCDWDAVPAQIDNSTLTNPSSGLCLQDGSPLPPQPHTCEAGSPSARLPFCDAALDVDARVYDLLARMSPALKLQQWNIGTGGFLYDPALNLKAFHWDFTCSKCARARARARKPAALAAASSCVAVAQRAAPAPRDPPPQSTASTTPTASRRRRR
jgi:hypothetical protein